MGYNATAPTAVTLALPDWVAPALDWDRAYGSDDERMRLVVALSRENVERRTGGPFGAAIFERGSGRLVAVGVNSVERLASSSAHAEVMALMLAQRRLGSYTLNADGATHELVTSCAPCAMCLGATLWSGVRRVVWGALRQDAEAIHFDEGPVFPESIAYMEARGIEMVPGVLRAEARAVLELYGQAGGRIYNG